LNCYGSNTDLYRRIHQHQTDLDKTFKRIGKQFPHSRAYTTANELI